MKIREPPMLTLAAQTAGPSVQAVLTGLLSALLLARVPPAMTAKQYKVLWGVSSGSKDLRPLAYRVPRGAVLWLAPEPATVASAVTSRPETVVPARQQLKSVARETRISR